MLCKGHLGTEHSTVPWPHNLFYFGGTLFSNEIKPN